MSSHLPGDRFPVLDVRVDGDEKSICVFELLKNVGFLALDFRSSDAERASSEKVEENCGMSVHYFKCEADRKEMDRASVKNMLYTVRPDIYVGFSAVEVDEKKMENSLSEKILF